MLESYPRLETGWIDEETEHQMVFLMTLFAPSGICALK